MAARFSPCLLRSLVLPVKRTIVDDPIRPLDKAMRRTQSDGGTRHAGSRRDAWRRG